MTQPKVFISYSWSSQKHQEQVRVWAERLLADGVDVVLDQFDLKEGHDKYVFMEQMVTDASVTHVLVISDKAYAEKADARKAGVGTETQIISKEVYTKVAQSKFIPLVCEFTEAREPYLPTFLSSRVWINFSSDSEVNKNWSRLIRLLFGKPEFEKPAPGNPPAYITADTRTPTNPAVGKFAVFQEAYANNSRATKACRRDFLAAVVRYVDALRTRTAPQQPNFPQWIVDGFRQLIPIRNVIVDWVLLEGDAGDDEEFAEALMRLLESLIELKSRPPEVTSWTNGWFNSHELFVYETFLYIVAALLRVGAYKILNSIFREALLRPEAERNGGNKLAHFDDFYTYIESINSTLSDSLKYHSQAAELIKRSADRTDVTFDSIKEADALACLAALTSTGVRWFPQTIYYWGYGSSSSFFIRAANKKHFRKLGMILGIQTGDEVRASFAKNLEEARQYKGRSDSSVESMINLKELDSVG
jgi:hypothetical protein